MSGSFNNRGELDPNYGRIVSCWGKKGSGKSIMGLLFFENYPYDKIVLDIAADDGPTGQDVHDLRGTVDSLPRKWPEHLRRDGEAMTLRYVPDPRSSTFAEDLDAVVALGMSHGTRTGHCALLCHEVGRLAPSNKVPPHTRAALMHNRHARLTMILCGPRPITVDSLVLSQSDLVYIFELPNPNDRRRIAENIGWDPTDLDLAVHALGPHEYLRADTNVEKPAEGQPDHRLLHFDRLPDDVVAQVQRYRHGTLPTQRAA